MEDPNRTNPVLAFTALLAILATLGVVGYTPAPFKGSRPTVPDTPCSPEEIRARLWQDPFQAVLDHVKPRDSRKKSALPAGIINFNPQITLNSQPALLEEEIQSHLQKGEVIILGIMVMGGPYGEDAEFRHRWRHAALAGLQKLKFHPEDPDHLKFLQIAPECHSRKKLPEDGPELIFTHFSDTGDVTDIDQELTLLNIVPFEWLSSSDAKKSVLLLWLNEASFSKSPLLKLERLQKLIGGYFKGEAMTPKLKLIGPFSSTTLLAMLKEGRTAPPEQVEVYSFATAEKNILLEKTKQSGITQSAVEDFFESSNFCRTICTDDQLALFMADELKARGLKRGDRIVLVAEWDTFYGRSLMQTFEDTFKNNLFNDINYKGIFRFSYLRGIDGKLPGELNGDAKQNKKDDSERKNGMDVKKLEEPMGKSQYDYLRRLAEMICRIEYSEGHIKAVGILGNDFYDKFLILQALKQRFRDKIFFTTDLDARLLHPDNIEWTRNLLVASSFDFQLHPRFDFKLAPRYEVGVPPFRDCYSTAVFAAVLHALEPDLWKKQDFTFDPRIFEIGQWNAVDLLDHYKGEPMNLAPAPVPEISGRRVVAISLYILFLILLFLWLWGWFANISGYIRIGWHHIALLVKSNPDIAILLFVVLIFTVKNLWNLSEEPFSLSEGISIWPTNLIRLFAIGLSIIFLALGVSNLRNNCLQIAREFELPRRESKGINTSWSHSLKVWRQTRLEQYRAIKNWLADIPKWLTRCNNETLPEMVPVNHKWEDYIRQGAFDRRWLKLLGIVFFYMIITKGLFWAWGNPVTPVRGLKNSSLNFIIIQLTIALFLFLTFFVLDATRHFRLFVRSFLQKKPQWELASLKQFGWEPDVPEDPDNMLKEALSFWMLIRLIALRTNVIGRQIFYPFIIWLIIFLSRHYYFDNWQTPTGLVIVILMGAVFAWFGTFMLRHSAETLKRDILERLDKMLITSNTSEFLGKSGHESSDYIQKVKAEVLSIRQGAFAPLLEQPAMQALLVPFGGLSTMRLFEYLSQLP